MPLPPWLPMHWLPPAAQFPPIDDHHAVGEAQGKGVLWIDFDQIAILGVDFDVHEPPELAEHLRELAGRLMRAAGPSA